MKKVKKVSWFDKVYSEVIVPHFESIKDDREGNLSISLVDALKSGFAIYSLKSASLLSFRKRSVSEDGNLQTIYGINKIPSDNGLRKILDNIPAEELRKGFNKMFHYLADKKVLHKYKYWQKHKKYNAPSA